MRKYTDIKITDETLPWKQPREPEHRPYSPHELETDGPERFIEFIAAGARMSVTPTRETGLNSGRRRFQIRCITCDLTVHKATTGTTENVGRHLFEVHNWDGAPATLIVTGAKLPFADGTVVAAQAEASPRPATIVFDTETTRINPTQHHGPDLYPPPIPPGISAEAPYAELARNGIKLAPASEWILTQQRPSWGDQFIMQAYITALRGSCLRKRVGAIIVDGNNRIISGGFNGAPSRMPDCLSVGCDVRLVDGRQSCVRTLHAESNALDYAGRQARGCALFTTVIPCRPCAMRIIQAGIDCVYYSEYYESQGTKETKELLTRAGVRLVHHKLPENELTIALRRAVGEIS